jgi:hypothetical protein
MAWGVKNTRSFVWHRLFGWVDAKRANSTQQFDSCQTVFVATQNHHKKTPSITLGGKSPLLTTPFREEKQGGLRPSQVYALSNRLTSSPI